MFSRLWDHGRSTVGFQVVLCLWQSQRYRCNEGLNFLRKKAVLLPCHTQGGMDVPPQGKVCDPTCRLVKQWTKMTFLCRWWCSEAFFAGAIARKKCNWTPFKQFKTCLDTYDSTGGCGLVMWASQFLTYISAGSSATHWGFSNMFAHYFPYFDWWSPRNSYKLLGARKTQPVLEVVSESLQDTNIILYIYILYTHMLTPPETYRFRFFIVFYSDFCWFCHHFFHSFEDFGCLIIMSHDASCVDTTTYFDGICSVFNYRIVFPTKGFNSNIDRMRTALWSNANFKLYIGFYSGFIPFCDTWNFGFWTPSDLADILFDDQYGRYFLGLFFLTM